LEDSAGSGKDLRIELIARLAELGFYQVKIILLLWLIFAVLCKYHE